LYRDSIESDAWEERRCPRPSDNSQKSKNIRERERKRKRKTLGEDCIKKNIERGGEELNGSYGRWLYRGILFTNESTTIQSVPIKTKVSWLRIGVYLKGGIFLKPSELCDYIRQREWENRRLHYKDAQCCCWLQPEFTTFYLKH